MRDRIAFWPETALFSGAVAVVGLHAVLDAFVAPEAGTGPGDHLLRGLAITFEVQEDLHTQCFRHQIVRSAPQEKVDIG